MKNITKIFAMTAFLAALFALTALNSCKPDPDKPQFVVIDHSATVPGENGDLELDYRFEYISWYTDDDVMRKIQAAQTVDFFGAEFVRVDPMESARAFDEATANGGYDWGGFIKIRSWADVLGDRVVAFVVERAEYTGGAHGLETTEYSNYDLHTGERLALDDIFTVEGKAALAGAIRDRILKDKGAASWDELMEKHCYNAASEIAPTENFLLSEHHITFVYNPYDIACYAEGATKVRLPLDGLAGFKNEMIRK